MRWMKYAVHEDVKVLVEKLTRIDHLEDLSVHGGIILKRILQKWDGKVFEQVWGCCEHGNELSTFAVRGELYDWLRIC
jgi:hypothetical protein